MADMQAALFQRLKDNAQVGALVGTKIYPMIVPQGKALPYIRIQYPSNLAEQDLKGDTGDRLARVQIDAFGSSFSQAWSVAEAARKALLQPGVAAGVRLVTAAADAPTPMPGEDTARGHTYRTRVDLRIWHTLA